MVTEEPMNNLLEAFFEDLAISAEYWVEGILKTIGEPDLNTQWAEDLSPYRRVGEALDSHTKDLEIVLKQGMFGLLHSFLVTLDGGSASAEKGRLNLVSEADGEILAEGLHELFYDHLWNTGRLD